MHFLSPISESAITIKPEHYRPDIDGLRALAVLAVVGFHAFPEWIHGGFIGVDIFFVLSGYLISTHLFESINKKKLDILDFYSRRIRRIFPSLLIVLFVCLLLGWFTSIASEYQQLGKHVASGAGFISNLILWGESGYFDNLAETKPLLHLWSLGVEEQFYIFWPLALWIGWKLRINLFILTTILSIASFGLNIFEINSNPIASFYSPQTRFWELLLGAVLAWLTLHQSNLLSLSTVKKIGALSSVHLQSLFSFMGLILILIGAWFIDRNSRFPGAWALLPTLGTVFLIAAGAKAPLNFHLLSNRVLVWFGLISYPFYLWHWPLLSFVRLLEDHGPNNWVRLLTVVLSIGLAWLSYRFIEIPIRYGAHQKLKTILLIVAMAIIGSAGYGIFQSNGLELRFPKESRILTSVINFNYAENVRSGICHIEEFQFNSHDPICFETQRPLIVLWGDSYASALYPGLKKIQEKNSFGIAQVTRGGCPPVFNISKAFDKPYCDNANLKNLKELITLKPQAVILSAAWIRQDYRWKSQDDLINRLNLTLDVIKNQLPNTKILLVGPFPQWHDSPQKDSFNFWRRNLLLDRAPPKRLHANQYKELNLALGQLAIASGVAYLSPVDALCNEQGCIAKTGDNPEDFIAMDYGHLSKSGSEFFSNIYKDQLLNLLK